MIPQKKTTTVETYDDGRTATRTEVTRTTEHDTVTAARGDCPEVATVSAYWSRKEQDDTEWLSAASLEVFIYEDHCSVYASGTFSIKAIRSTCGIRIDDAICEIWWVLSDILELVDVDADNVDGKGLDLLDCMSHGVSWGVNVDDNGDLAFSGSDYILRSK